MAITAIAAKEKILKMEGLQVRYRDQLITLIDDGCDPEGALRAAKAIEKSRYANFPEETLAMLESAGNFWQ